MRVKTLIFIWVSFAVTGANAMPVLTGIEPLAIPSGKAIEVKLIGSNFSEDLRLWTSFNAEVGLVKRIDAKQVVFRIKAINKLPREVGVLRVHDRTGLSDPVMLLIDDVPTTNALSTDKTKAQMLKLPAALDGKTAGVNSHWFVFEAMRGQAISVEVYAERIGSKADPIIRLINPNGREVDYADDDDVLGSDAGLTHVTKVEGRYLLELRDVQYRAGLQYRLRIGGFRIWPEVKAGKGEVIEKEPNDNYKKATLLPLGRVGFGCIEKAGARDHFQITGAKDQWVRFHAHSRRIGSPAYIYLELLNIEGKPVATAGTETTSQPILCHKLPASGDFILRVEELLKRGGKRYAYRIDSHGSSGGFQLQLKNGKSTTEKFWGIPGQQIELSIQVERKGYDGPITLSVANGWKVADNLIKANANAAQLKVVVPKETNFAELHHLVIRGKGDAEKTVEASIDLFSNLRQRWPQMAFPPAALQGVVPVAVIEPAQVTMAAVKMKQGTKVKLRVTTKRPPEPIGLKAAPQQIAIELKNLPAGVTAPSKIVVDAKKDFVEFELTATGDAKPGKSEIVAVAKSKYRGAAWIKESMAVTIEVLKNE